MSGLTWRDWRWLWLWQVLDAVVLLALIVPWAVLYLPAKTIVWAFERAFGVLGDRWGAVHARCRNRDLARKRGAA